MELFNRLGDRAAQAQDLDLLQGLAQRLNDLQRLARVDMLFAHYFISIGDYPAVIDRSERAMQMSGAVEDADIALDTYRVWPLALLRLGKLEEAMKIAHEGRRLAQVYSQPVKEGYILNSMGLIAIEQKDPAIAHAYLERALAIARETGDRRLEARALTNLGNSAGFIRQDYAAAREYYEGAYLLNHEAGERSAESVTLGNLGWVAGMQGDFLAARWYLDQAVLTAREVGNVYLETNSLINLSAITGAGNEAQSSLGYAQNALSLASKTGDRAGEAWSLLYLGYAYLLLSELDKADKLFRQSMAIRDELGQPGPKTEPVAGLIQTLLLKNELAAAMSETEKLIAYLATGGTLEGTEEPLRVYYACYLALVRTHDPRSKHVLSEAVRLLEEQISRLGDDGSRQMYVENVPWRKAILQAWHATSS
jgi:tetratricopeptide (TPR) repeat protein